MKKLIFAIVMTVSGIFCGAAAQRQQADPVAPAFLKPGDKVAILSLSSKAKPGTIEAGTEVFRRWGYEVVVGEHAHGEWRTFAATHEDRAADLLKALRDPEVKAIISSRGGYGSANVLALIPIDTLRKYPKWIIGYSDITGYLSAEVRAGNMAIHSNMCGALKKYGGTDYASETLRNILEGKAMPSYDLPGNKWNQPGEASGIVVGGNMCVYSDLAATPYDFLDPAFTDGRDIILFIEDVGEGLARIDRMIQLLRLRGILHQVKGIIVGRFTEYQTSRGYADMNEMIHDNLKDLEIPVCYDFPVGHDESWNYPMVEGAKATLTVTKDKVTLNYH